MKHDIEKDGPPFLACFARLLFQRLSFCLDEACEGSCLFIPGLCRYLVPWLAIPEAQNRIRDTGARYPWEGGATAPQHSFGKWRGGNQNTGREQRGNQSSDLEGADSGLVSEGQTTLERYQRTALQQTTRERRGKKFLPKIIHTPSQRPLTPLSHHTVGSDFISETIQTMSDVLKNPKFCSHCGAAGCTMKCQCQKGYYCDKKCQRANWGEHKKNCSFALAREVKDAKKEHGKEDTAVADARLQAGHSHCSEGRYVEAQKCFVEARRVYLAARGQWHPDVALACSSLGELYQRMGRYNESHEELQQSLQIMSRIHGKRSIHAAECLHLMGTTFVAQDKLEEALEKLEEARGIYEEGFGPEDDDHMAKLLDEMGMCHRLSGRFDEARKMHTESLRIYRKNSRGADSTHVAVSLTNLGNAFYGQGMAEEARPFFEEALEMSRRLHGEKHPSVAVSLGNMANIMKSDGQLDEALKLMKKSLKIKRRIYGGEEHVDVALTLFKIGGILITQKKYDEALEYSEEALKNYTSALGVDNKMAAMVHHNIALAKHGLEDFAGAVHSCRQAVRVYKMHGINTSESAEATQLLRRLELPNQIHQQIWENWAQMGAGLRDAG